MFFKIIKKYRFKSLFFKLFLSIFVILVVLLSFLAIMYFHMTTENANNKIHNTQITAIHSLAIEIDDMIDSAFSATHLICSNDTVLDYLNGFAASPNTLSTQVATFTEITNYILLNSNTLESVYLYKNLDRYVLSKSTSGYDYAFADMGWYDKYCENDKQDSIFYRESHAYNERNNYITVCCNIYSGATISGILVYNFNTDIILSSVNALDCDNFLFCGATGKVFYSTDTEQIGTTVDIPSKELYSYASGNRFYINDALDKCGGYVQAIFGHYTLSSQSLPSYIGLVFLLVFTVIIVSAAVSYMMSYKFYNSILMIIDTIHHDTTDNSPINDYKYVGNHILDSKSDLPDYEEALVKSLSTLKKMQLTVLQSQINPHFIFNTLNLICTMDMAENKSDTKLSKTVRLLSDILREVLYSTENVIDFGHELSYLEKYMDLQSIKYDNQFKYTEQIDPKTLPLSCAKFILQPIVENAFKHGISYVCESPFEIIVRSRLDGKKYLIEISNNGAAIPPDKLSELQELLENDNDFSASHIGLANVNSRIKLLFGEQYGLSIDSDETGVSVLISLPSIQHKKQ